MLTVLPLKDLEELCLSLCPDTSHSRGGLLFSGFQPERTGWTPQPRHWTAGCPRTRSRPNNTDGTRPGRGEMVPPKKRIINWPLHQSPPHRITEETRLDVTSGAHPGNPLLKQDHVQMPSERLQGWRATTLPGKLLPVLGRPHGGKASPNVQGEP